MAQFAVVLIFSTLFPSAWGVGHDDVQQRNHHTLGQHSPLAWQQDSPVSFTELLSQMQHTSGGSSLVAGSDGPLSSHDSSSLPSAAHSEHLLQHDSYDPSFVDHTGQQAYPRFDPSALYDSSYKHLPPPEPVAQGASQWFGQDQLSELPPLPPSLLSPYHYAMQNQIQLSLSDDAVRALQHHLSPTGEDGASSIGSPWLEKSHLHENQTGQIINNAVFTPPVPQAKPHRRKSLQVQHERIKAQIRTFWREKQMYVGMDPRSLAMKVTEMKLQIGFPQQIGHMVGHIVRKEARVFDHEGKYVQAYNDWIARFNKKVSALRREYEYDDERFSSDESRERMVYEKFRDTRSREDMYGGFDDSSSSSAPHQTTTTCQKRTFPPNSEQAEDRVTTSIWNDFMRLRIRPVFGSKVDIDALSITTIEDFSHGWHSDGYSVEQTTEYLKRYLRRFLLRSEQELDLFDLLRRATEGTAGN